MLKNYKNIQFFVISVKEEKDHMNLPTIETWRI